MTQYGIFLGLVGTGLTAVVVYHYADTVPMAAGLAEKLHPFMHPMMVSMTRAIHILRLRLMAIMLVILEHFCRAFEQVPSEVMGAIHYLGSVGWMDYLRSIAWMDHVHTTNAAVQQVYAMGTAALAGIKHTVSVLDSTIRATTRSEIAPYLTFSIVMLVMWLVRFLLLAVAEFLRLLVYAIGVGLHGAGVLALVHTFCRGIIWLLVYTLHTINSSANTVNAVLQFLAQNLAVSPSPTAIKPTKCKI